MTSTKTALLGKWRITGMDQWDQDYTDVQHPGHVTFTKGGSGQLHFGCVDLSLDWRYDASLDRADFTFAGFDEGTEVSGRGWAKLESQGKQMVGHIVFHEGDESGFTAKKGR